MLGANTDLSSYLWPGYNEEASNFHVLLIALISNVKHREHLATWGMLPLTSKKTIINDR